MQKLGGSNAQIDALAAFFGMFQRIMNERVRIPKSVLASYLRYINFLVSTYFCFMEAIDPRTIWIFELEYEVKMFTM